MILGQKSIDDWDTYMAELKELGLDEMLEILSQNNTEGQPQQEEAQE